MTGIALEVMPDEGAPQVGITIDGVGSSAVVSVDVSWDEGDTWHRVRGADRLDVATSAFVRDHVCPLNVEATYRLTVHSGTTPDTLEDTITVASDTAWLQDPLNPRGAVPVVVVDGPGIRLVAARSGAHKRTIATDYAYPEGSRLPVVSTGARQAPSGIEMLLDAAASQGALVKALVKLTDSAGQIVARGLLDDVGLDPVLHLAVGDIADSTYIEGGVPYRAWELTADQVRPTTTRVAIPWWTYADVAALWSGSTYADVLAARPGATYLDWLRDPTPTGA